MSKCSALLLLLVLVSSSLIMSGFVCASTPKPSVPEFTLNYVDHSYDVPPKPSSSTDPYTGNTITATIPGYHVENKTIDADITNNGASYYNFRYKGHYETDWSYYPFNQIVKSILSLPDAHEVPFHASTSSHTVLSLYFLPDIPVNGTLDIQVQALFGDFRAEPYVHLGGVPGGPTYDFYWEGEASNWSNTQTISIDETAPVITPEVSLPAQSLSPTESQNPTSTQLGPQTAIQPGNDWVQLAIVALLGVVAILLSVTVAHQLNRRKK